MKRGGIFDFGQKNGGIRKQGLLNKEICYKISHYPPGRRLTAEYC